MENAAIIRNRFGLTQEEMAQLLEVNRTQWSMYEIGRRDVPSAAIVKIANVTLHLQNATEPSVDSQRFLKEEHEKRHDWLKREKSALEYKKRLLEKKIEAMESKRIQCYAALEVVNYLALNKEQHSSLGSGIEARAKSTLRKNALHHLEELYLKKEHLDHLIKSVAEKMK